MKIIFPDAKTIGDDLDLSIFDSYGEVIKYDHLSKEELSSHLKDADIIVTNKCEMNEESLKEASHLQLICITATGTNNLDKEYLKKRGILWRNVAGYSTDMVAQHTFALYFYLSHHLPYYDAYVKHGTYAKSPIFTHFEQTFGELSGKTWGIIGLGAIGRRVADIAKAFGCKVIYYSASGAAPQDGYTQVDFSTLLEESDIVSVHAPLNEFTENLMNLHAFEQMKPTAIFLNLGRGPIVVEKDLAKALNDHLIAGAGLDVLCREPITKDHPLGHIQHPEKLIITPHLAWAGKEARTRLMNIVSEQIQEFLNQ